MAHNINLLQVASHAGGPVVSLGLVIAAPLSVAAFVTGMTMYLNHQTHTLENRIEAAQAAARLSQGSRANDAAGSDLAVLEHAVEVRNGTLTALKNGAHKDATGYAEHFRALARSTIDGVWLTGVTIDHDGTTLRGRTLDPARLSAYLESLRREPLFAGHPFNIIDMKSPQDANAAAVDPAHPATSSPWLDFQLAARRPGTGGEPDTKDNR